jgi:predicted RNase H-like HicB family nuclease
MCADTFIFLDFLLRAFGGQALGRVPSHPEANWNIRAGTMIRKYSLVIEGDSNGYSAYVPELPTILVTGASVDELSARAREAIRTYWQNLQIDRSPTSQVREIEVELQA